MMTYIAGFVLLFEMFGNELDSLDGSDDLGGEVVSGAVRVDIVLGS